MDNFQSYSSFASIYDALTSDVEYEKRCDYLEKLFAKHSKSKPSLICDLGCGTGSVCSILSKRGYDMIGIDSSEFMLDVASKKEGREKILYLNQDMTEFELYGTVDVFLCMLDSLNYITETEDLDKVFSLVKNYLNPDGLFIFDVNTLYKYKNILSDNTFVFEENDIFTTWENSFDGQWCDYLLNFFVKGENGYTRYREEHSQKYHSDETIRKTAQKYSLKILAVYSELSFDKPGVNDERIFYVLAK